MYLNLFTYSLYNNYNKYNLNWIGNMIIKIRFNSEPPIYEQLKRQIIIGVAYGSLKPGERLSSLK